MVASIWATFIIGPLRPPSACASAAALAAPAAGADQARAGDARRDGAGIRADPRIARRARGKAVGFVVPARPRLMILQIAPPFRMRSAPRSRGAAIRPRHAQSVLPRQSVKRAAGQLFEGRARKRVQPLETRLLAGVEFGEIEPNLDVIVFGPMRQKAELARHLQHIEIIGGDKPGHGLEAAPSARIAGFRSSADSRAHDA